MRYALAIALAALALAGSCGFERPDRLDMDGATIDATLDDGPPAIDAPAIDAPATGQQLTGGITVTGGISTAGSLRLVDDGVEGVGRSCAGALCVTGFLGP
jgi:hypothetical protein